MQKIMFNDRYGLTQAVLDERKTMTRRIITCPKSFKGEWVAGFNVHRRQSDNQIIDFPCMYDADEREFDGGAILPKYKVGEIIAIAQAYSAAGFGDTAPIIGMDENDMPIIASDAGLYNKMFVRADLMPHQIRITNVRVEKLQDISDEDCIREGVVKIERQIATKAPQFVTVYYPCQSLKESADKLGWGITYNTPRKAFAALIDKVSGRGTWLRNPFVFVYEFELVK